MTLHWTDHKGRTRSRTVEDWKQAQRIVDWLTSTGHRNVYIEAPCPFH